MDLGFAMNTTGRKHLLASHALVKIPIVHLLCIHSSLLKKSGWWWVSGFLGSCIMCKKRSEYVCSRQGGFHPHVSPRFCCSTQGLLFGSSCSKRTRQFLKVLLTQWNDTADGRNPARWDVKNFVNNGINYLSTGAGFQPSAVVSPNLPKDMFCLFSLDAVSNLLEWKTSHWIIKFNFQTDQSPRKNGYSYSLHLWPHPFPTILLFWRTSVFWFHGQHNNPPKSCNSRLRCRSIL